MNKDMRMNITIVNLDGHPIKKIENVWIKSFDGETLIYFYHENILEYEVKVNLDVGDVGGVMIQYELWR